MKSETEIILFDTWAPVTIMGIILIASYLVYLVLLPLFCPARAYRYSEESVLQRKLAAMLTAFFLVTIPMLAWEYHYYLDGADPMIMP